MQQSNRSDSDAYKELLEALRSCGLDWVARQVQDQVRLGKPTIKSVTPSQERQSDRFADNSQEASGSGSRRKQKRSATEDYSASERLELVIEAIRTVIVDSFEIQDELINILNNKEPDMMPIMFEPEEFEDSERLELSTITIDRRKEVDRFRQLLEKLDSERGSNGDL